MLVSRESPETSRCGSQELVEEVSIYSKSVLGLIQMDGSFTICFQSLDFLRDFRFCFMFSSARASGTNRDTRIRTLPIEETNASCFVSQTWFHLSGRPFNNLSLKFENMFRGFLYLHLAFLKPCKEPLEGFKWVPPQWSEKPTILLWICVSFLSRAWYFHYPMTLCVENSL